MEMPPWRRTVKLIFNPVTLDAIKPYLELWKKVPQKSSDYSSGVLLCWERALGYQLSFEEELDLVWIRGEKPETHYLAPVGRWDRDDWETVVRGRFGSRARFRLVPEALVSVWRRQFGDAMQATEDRGSWEYLHRARELADLSGNKYMRKRNRVNQFTKQNPYSYLRITPELLPRIAEFQEAWCESYRIFASGGSIEQESEGIVRAILGNWEALPQLRGGAIEVRGKIVAYTIAEDAGDGVIMIHFEKASLEYNSAFQVINREFLLRDATEFEIVNREEDMNDPGLRDAKMSYHAFDFVKKYTVDIAL